MEFNIEQILITCFEGSLFIGAILILICFIQKDLTFEILKNSVNFKYSAFSNSSFLNRLIIASVIYTAGIFTEYISWIIYKPLILKQRILSLHSFPYENINYLVNKFRSRDIDLFYKCKNLVYSNKNYFDELLIREQRIYLMLAFLTSIAIITISLLILIVFELIPLTNKKSILSQSKKFLFIWLFFLVATFMLCYLSVQSELLNYNLRIFGYAFELLRN
jgi:hypothetical protein